MKRYLLLLMVVFVFCVVPGMSKGEFTSLLQAEDPERGRLPDGRAFRKDVQGNQIIDYIAELELAIEAQERRVHGLEHEVEQKQEEIEKIRAGSTSSDGGLSERDLLAVNHAHSQVDTNSGQAELSGRVARCVKELEGTESKLKEAQRALTVARDDLEVEVGVSAKQKGTFDTQISRLKGELSNRDDRITTLQLELKKLQQQQAVKVASRKTSSSVAEVSDERASLGIISTGSSRQPKKPARPSGSTARLSNARLRAVESLKGSIRTELNQTRSTIVTRDKLFKKFKVRSDMPVAFRPTKAVSSRGQSLTQIGTAITKARSVYQLSQYQRELHEIEKKMKDDIALMQRIGQ